MTQSQYALQKNVELLGDTIFQLEEQHSTHISSVVYDCVYSIRIGYLVHWYLSTGLLTFKVFYNQSCDYDEAII